MNWILVFLSLAWWDSNYTKMKPCTLSVGSGGADSLYQVKIIVDYDSDMQSDFDDIRFVDETESNELDFWLQEKVDSDSAIFWVEEDDSIKTTKSLCYMYYGNAGASSASCDSTTFVEAGLTDFTEVDPNSHLAVVDSAVWWNGLARNEDAYVYKDKGVDFFDGNFKHFIEAIDSGGSTARLGVYWSLQNVVDDIKAIGDASGDCLAIYTYNGELFLRECIGGTAYTDGYNFSVDVLYYLTVVRDETIGTYGAMYCNIYSDYSRTTLVDSLHVALHEKEDFRYVFMTNTYNSGNVYLIDGISQNLRACKYHDPEPTYAFGAEQSEAVAVKKGIPFEWGWPFKELGRK